MPVAWYVTSFRRLVDPTDPRPARECRIRDYITLINADGGDQAYGEILGGRALVKVLASEVTLGVIAADPAFVRLPLANLGDRISTLTANQRRRLRDWIIDAGYTEAETPATLPSTFGEVLDLFARRRLRSRYDATTDTIILDGQPDPCRPVFEIDQAVRS